MASYDFSRYVWVPYGRTYVFREFRFLPSAVIYDTDNVPYPNFYSWRWVVSGTVPKGTVAADSQSSGALSYFSGAGSMGFMDCYFVVGEGSLVKLEIKTIDIAGAASPNLVLGGVSDVRVNSLLADSRAPDFQPSNDAKQITETLRMGGVP